jgi:methionyl-tRNA formyltransferase
MPSSLNLVFCGTPGFAVPTLDKLVEAGFRVHLVVTQPDRPKGRGLELVSSQIKERASQLGLPIPQPERIKNNEEFRAQLTALHPDAIIVVGYGRIIPQWMLDLPPLGNINLHASLLPKYRGAAPIQWAIARGETITGVTTMKIDAGLDTGDILQQQEIPIAPSDTAETLAPKLAAAGAGLMVETLRGLRTGSIHPRPQDRTQATLAPILKKEDGLIDFSRPAREILNRMRGFQPWPGAYSRFRNKNLQVWKAAAFDRSLPPSQLQVDGGHLLVGCSQGTAIELLELQLEGKRRTLASDFVRGYRLLPGEKLGS